MTGAVQVAGAVGAGTYAATIAGSSAPLLPAMAAIVGAIGAGKTVVAIGDNVAGSLRHKLKR